MTATPYLLQLPDPDKASASSDGNDTFVVVAESSADALAFVQNFASAKVWANVTPGTLAEAANMSGWNLHVAIFNTDGTVFLDTTVSNSSQVERVVLATGVLTSSTNYGASDTVTIGTRVYHFVATPAVDGDVKIAGSEAASITNLAHAINGSGGTPGTDYVVTAPDPSVTAVAAAHTLTVTALSSIPAATANAIATTDSMTTGNGVWGAATLTGGVDSSNKLSSLAELMVAALNGAGVGIANASFNNSTHVLTVAGTADVLGDHLVVAEVTPPQPNPVSPTGVATKAGTSVPGFVGTITSGGSSSAALTVALVADTYGIPNLIVKARVLQ